jgi:phage protein D
MSDTTYKIEINKTPAEPDILEAIDQIEVEDNGTMADVFRLKIPITATPNGDWSFIADEHFQPLTEIHIALKVGSTVESLIKGYITDRKVHFATDPGASYLEIVGMDATCLMNLEQKIKEWPNMADSDIAAAIFSEYGFTPDVESTQPTHSETEIKIIQRGTDIQFLRTLARRNGFECCVESDPTTSAITGYFKKPRLSGTPQKDLSVAFGADTNIKTLEIAYACMRPTTAQIQQLNIKTKSVNTSTTPNTTLDVLGKDSVLDILTQKPNILLRSSGASTPAELQALCDAAVDNEAWAIVASGEVDVTAYQSILRSKRTVLVKGAGSQFSGIYYVSRVFHTITHEGYTQRFELKRNALNLKGNEQFEQQISL